MLEFKDAAIGLRKTFGSGAGAGWGGATDEEIVQTRSRPTLYKRFMTKGHEAWQPLLRDDATATRAKS